MSKIVIVRCAICESNPNRQEPSALFIEDALETQVHGFFPTRGTDGLIHPKEVLENCYIHAYHYGKQQN